MAPMWKAKSTSAGSLLFGLPIWTQPSNGRASWRVRQPSRSKFGLFMTRNPRRDRRIPTGRPLMDAPDPQAGQTAAQEIERVFRRERGRAVAVLIRFFGDIDEAEEAVQEAFVAALERWPDTGVPPSPVGWIITTARNRAIDRHRREGSREDRHVQAELLRAPEEMEEETVVRDDTLRLIFTCCHPSLDSSAQVALTLRLVAGLTTTEVA